MAKEIRNNNKSKKEKLMENRTELMAFRLTKEEKEMLETVLDDRTMSVYIRKALMKQVKIDLDKMNNEGDR